MAVECSSCQQMKTENKRLNKALMDTNKEYVEVVNENLALRSELERLSTRKGLYYDAL